MQHSLPRFCREYRYLFYLVRAHGGTRKWPGHVASHPHEDPVPFHSLVCIYILGVWQGHRSLIEACMTKVARLTNELEGVLPLTDTYYSLFPDQLQKDTGLGIQCRD